MWRQDWKQLKKNLEVEREEWAIYAKRRDLAKLQTAEAIEMKREEMEKKKKCLEEEFKKFKVKKEAEFKRKDKWAHREYMKQVEKKFKPSIK